MSATQTSMNGQPGHGAGTGAGNTDAEKEARRKALEEIAALPATVPYQDPLGGEFTVEVPVGKLLELRKFLGSRGYVSGSIPPLGFVRPYAEHDRFDWSVIGATPGFDKDRNPGVWCRGAFWTRRTFAATTGKKAMPAKIKYSRGDRPGDAPECIEKGSGDFNYVTLISFVDEGPVNANYLLKNGPANGSR